MPTDTFRLIFLGGMLFIAQISVVPLIKIGAAIPDLLLIFVLMMARRNSIYGVVSGFLVGLAQDLLTAKYFGIYALIKCTIGFWVGWYLMKKQTSVSISFWILIILSASIFQYLFYSIFFLQGSDIDFGAYLYQYSLPAIIYTSVAGVLWVIRPSKSRKIT